MLRCYTIALRHTQLYHDVDGIGGKVEAILQRSCKISTKGGGRKGMIGRSCSHAYHRPADFVKTGQEAGTIRSYVGEGLRSLENREAKRMAICKGLNRTKNGRRDLVDVRFAFVMFGKRDRLGLVDPCDT
jgi:hypothetical protein